MRFLGLKLPMMSSAAMARKNGDFDPSTFLATIGEGRKTVAVPKSNLYSRKAMWHLALLPR
jgi:hypothetical protein